MAQGLLQLIDESEYELQSVPEWWDLKAQVLKEWDVLEIKKTSQCDIGVTQQLHLSDVEKEIEKDICVPLQ